MPKLLPHYVLPKSLASNPLLKKLVGDKLFDFDDPKNIVQIPCERQLIIPRQLDGDPVLKLLAHHNLFDFEGEANATYLPIARHVARKLCISPHSEQPLESYLNGIRDKLKRVRDSPDFTLAQNGDQAAVDRLGGEVSLFQKVVAKALADGKLYVAHP